MEELPYRAPFALPTVIEKEKIVDEADLSTLQTVRKLLKESLDGLSKDFNAFDTLADANPEVAARNLLSQIQARQLAYQIIAPLYDSVHGVITLIESRYKED